jgi:hypothetical protein
MILLALIASIQYFILGATPMPPLSIFVVIITGVAIETILEVKILFGSK